MPTTSLPMDGLELTHDDRVLLHAVAIAGDVVREADLTYLLARWPWTFPMERSRVAELEHAGLLMQAADGWFVPLGVDERVSAALPVALDPMLRGFVGEMLCRGADSMDRFQLGFRRMVAGGREASLVSATRHWADRPAGRRGPRGARFVEALGAGRLGATLSARLAAAVPELPREPRWRQSLGAAALRVPGSHAVARVAATAAMAAVALRQLIAESLHLAERLPNG